MAIVEVCVGSINSAIAALDGDASRVELCDNLNEGGTTPSYGTLQIVRRLMGIPIHVLIRPRGGDFIYSDEEFEAMLMDIQMCRKLKMDGVVFGFLKADGEIDIKKTKIAQKEAGSLPVTFHRAFDMTPDPYFALDTLIELRVERVLTSGQKNTAIEGRELIKELVVKAADQIVVMAGSGLNPENINEFAEYTGAKEYHGTMRSVVRGEMIYKKEGISMGGNPNLSEFERYETDPGKVAKFVTSLKNL